MSEIRDRLARLLPDAEIRETFFGQPMLDVSLLYREAKALADRLEQAETAGGPDVRCTAVGHVAADDGGCVVDGCGCPCHVGWERAAQEVSDAVGDVEGYTITETISNALAEAECDREQAEADRAALQRVETVIDSTEWGDWPGRHRFLSRIRRALNPAAIGGDHG